MAEVTLRETLPKAAAPQRSAHPISLTALGMGLGTLFVFSYALCVLLYLLFPGLVLGHAVLSLFLPGFELLSLPGFLIGLVESFGYGWYVALIFAPTYNFFAARSR